MEPTERIETRRDAHVKSPRGRWRLVAAHVLFWLAALVWLPLAFCDVCNWGD